MRQYLAATVALSSALLLASCAASTDPSGQPDETASAASTPSPSATETVEPTVLSVEQSCAGFYDGGKESLAARIETTLPLATKAVTDETSVDLATTRDKIASVQRFAADELQENLNGIKAPFQAALEGADVTTDTFQPSLDAFRAQCEDDGYAFS